MMFKLLIDQELERKGFRTVQQKADACGIVYETMRRILKGEKSLSDEKIVEIAKKIGVDDNKIAEMIFSKTYDKAKDPEQKKIIATALKNMKEKPAKLVGDSPAHIPDEIDTIPIYNTIKAGDSKMGITSAEPSGDTISINDEYKRMRVFALRVSGDSMANELYDGEIAIFKPINGDEIKDRDIYAVEVEGWSAWVVKYVRFDPSGMVQLISANSAFPVKEIDPKENQVILRGKLIESRRLRK